MIRRTYMIQCAVSIMLLIGVSVHLCAGPLQASGSQDSGELEPFLDNFFSTQLRALNIPGAAFVLVDGGRIVIAKGYGYANLEEKIPVDPERTVFRVGSNSKMFVATAIMQLVERNKLNLSHAVNQYLKGFSIPEKYSSPITVTHLLTHTAGFDDIHLDISTLEKEKLIPLGEFLRTHMPEGVIPPGTVTSYSNYGFALAGYIVEQLSGIPFDRYVAENILVPLGMRRSGFVLTADLAEHLATGYLYRDGRFEPMPYDYDHIYPAGSFMTTATDMARFMIAHLQKGRFNNRMILKADTARIMQQQQFTNHPALPGIACCFIESFQNNQRILEHGGWVAGFKTLTVLIPEHNWGFFVSSNHETMMGGNHYALQRELKKQLLNRFFPVEEKPRQEITVHIETDRLVGCYRNNRRSRNTITKLGVFMNDLCVSSDGDGTITVGKNRYTPKDKLLFEREDGGDLVAFREDAEGNITHLFIGSVPTVAFDRLNWYETSNFFLGLVIFCFIIFLSVCPGYPLLRLFRLAEKRSPFLQRAYLIAGVVGLLNVICFASIVIIMLTTPQISFTWELPGSIYILLVIPLLTTLLTVSMVILSTLIWIRHEGTLAGRLYYSLITLAALFFLYFLHFWNLLGYRLG